jgi:hypothetical protein
MQRASRAQSAAWWIGALLIIAGVMTYFYHHGENSRALIIDSLDSYLPAHAVLARGDDFLAATDSTFKPLLGGIPRGSLPSETRLFLWLYRYLSPFHAYVAMEIILRVVALAGMVLLLRRHVLPNASAVVIFGASLSFALLPFYVHADLSVTGQPLLAYALLNIRQRDNSPYNWLIVAVFPFTSSLPFIGFAIVPIVALWIAGEWLATRRFPARLSIALALLVAGYGASEYRLLALLGGGHGFVSHRTEYVYTAAPLSRVLVHTAEDFAAGNPYAPSLQDVIILPAAILAQVLGVLLSRREKNDAKRNRQPEDIACGGYRHQLQLLVVLIFVCAGISCWWGFCSSRPFVAILNSPAGGSVRTLQLHRLNLLHPALWTLVFAVTLAMLSTALAGGRWVAAALVVVQLFVVVAAERREHEQQKLTFAEFFSPALFRDIRDFIARPPENYRVVSLGLNPSIALYNGFHTADGYWVNYPLAYKHRFRRAMAGELAKDADLTAYFDEWGSRCFLFSAELGRRYLYTKDSGKRRIERLNIDTGVLSDLGVEYILSAVEIGNAEELNLKLEHSFERGDSPWKIFLYSLPHSSASSSNTGSSRN